MFAFAYIPGSVGAATHGPSGLLPASPDSAILALIVVNPFLAASFGVADMAFAGLRRFEPPQALRERAGTIALLVLLAATLAAALTSGFWSYYGGSSVEQLGGFRLEVIYLDTVIAVVLLCARKVFRSPNVIRGRPMVWLAIGAFAFLLLFVMQSRRYMLFAVGFIILDVWLTYRRRRQSMGLRAWIVGLSALFVTGSAFYASYVWRATTLDNPDRGVLTAIVETGRGVVEGEASRDDLVSATSSRLTYLWIDSVAWEYRGRLQAPFSLGDAFLDTVMRATPTMILGSNLKERSEMVNCDGYLSQLGIDEDIPCTAVSEVVLSDSIVGGLIVVALQGIALGFGLWLTRAKGDMSSALGFIVFAELSIIESSAFAPVLIARQLLIVAGIALPLVLLLRAMENGRLKARV